MDTSEEVSYIQYLAEHLLAFVAECLFYGIYVALMTVCWTAVRSTEKLFHVATLLALFGLSTAHLILSVITMRPLLRAAFDSSSDYHQVVSDFTNWSLRYDTIAMSIFMTSNVVVGCLLLYRCYMIWGTHPMRYIIALPSLLLLLTVGKLLPAFRILADEWLISPTASAISALVPVVWNAGHSYICQILFYAGVLSENVLVTCLMAWRIWQVKRKARNIVSRDLQKRYTTAISIILQSGIIYPIFIIVYIILAFDSALNRRTTLGPRIILSCLAQLVGITPTWIIVRGAMSQRVVGRGTIQSMFAPRTPVVPRISNPFHFHANNTDPGDNIPLSRQ